MRQTDKVQLWPGTCLCDSSQKKLCHWSRTHSACKPFCSNLSSGTSNHIISEESRGWEKDRTYKHGTPQDSGSVVLSFHLFVVMCINLLYLFPLASIYVSKYYLCIYIWCEPFCSVTLWDNVFGTVPGGCHCIRVLSRTWYLTCPKLINNTSLL